MHFGAADIEETLVLLGTCQVRFRHVCADLLCRGHAVLMLSRVHQYSAASRDCTSCRVCDSRVYVMHASQAAQDHESGCVLQGLTSQLHQPLLTTGPQLHTKTSNRELGMFLRMLLHSLRAWQSQVAALILCATYDTLDRPHVVSS